MSNDDTKWNKSQLIEKARELGLSVSGNKAALQERIAAHLAEEAGDDEELTAGQRMARHLVRYRQQYQKCSAYSGNPSANNGDGIAGLLAGCDPNEAIKLAEKLLDMQGQLQAKYEHLNPGQQRMNAGNRIRAAIKRGDVTEEQVAETLSKMD